MNICEKCGVMPETMIGELCSKCAYEKNPELFREPKEVDRSEDIAAVCQCGKVTQEMINGLCLYCAEHSRTCTACGYYAEKYLNTLDGVKICFDCYEKVKEKQEQKPPIGLKPRNMAEHDRKVEIIEAANRYVVRSEPIPIEWIEEYNDIVNGEKRRARS